MHKVKADYSERAWRKVQAQKATARARHAAKQNPKATIMALQSQKSALKKQGIELRIRDLSQPKQSTRLLKAYCPVCEATWRMSAKWAEKVQCCPCCQSERDDLEIG